MDHSEHHCEPVSRRLQRPGLRAGRVPADLTTFGLSGTFRRKQGMAPAPDLQGPIPEGLQAESNFEKG